VATGNVKARIHIFLALFLAAFLFTGYFLRHTYSALLTSLFFAYLCNPLLKYLERKGFSRALSLSLLYGILALAALFASFVIVPYVVHQVNAFTTSFPRYAQNLKGALDTWKLQLQPYYGDEELGWLADQASDSLNRLMAEVSGRGYERLKGFLFALFDLMLAPVLVFFILYYKEELKEMVLRFAPPDYREELIDLGRKINWALQRYILAMVFDCLIVGVLCSVTLALLNVEFPVINGMLAGFATIVPFVGALLSVIPPALIGYAKSGDLTIIPKVCFIYFLINMVIEGNLIKPLIMQGTFRLNPLAVIFSVMALGEIMGFWGIVLAVPLVAVIKTCAGDIREELAGNAP